MLSKVEYFQKKATKGKELKILTPKQMIESLPIAISQARVTYLKIC